MKITTNNVPRDVLTIHDLTDAERADFDYFDADTDCGMFVRYKGIAYDLAEFQTTSLTPQMRDAGFGRWDGYQSDSFFSGVLVRFTGDSETVVMGWYYC